MIDSEAERPHVLKSTSAMDDDTQALPDVRIERGAPLVASTPRWLALAAGEAAIVFGLAYAYISLSHSKQTLASMALPLAITAIVAAAVTLAMLRAEEARLARELRTARSGTAAIRSMVLQRRERAPMLLRLLSTSFGTAAVLIAEGERSAALDALAASSPIMAMGRIRLLRQVIEADADRAGASLAGLTRCIETIRAMPRIGNTEADRYRTHVLVKAVLTQAHGELAEELCAELAASKDEDERIYAAWLSAWFEIDLPTEPSDGEVRLALLMARSQGAEDLAKKLEAKLSTGSPLQPPAAPST